MSPGGSDGKIKLILYLFTATDGIPRSPMETATLYAVNETHARRRAKPWIDEHHERLPHIDVKACPEGFTQITTALPGQIEVFLSEATDYSEVQP